MTKICDFKRIFSIFLLLFITTVSTQNLSPTLCGGLHSGMDPCKECSDSQSVLVKAQTLPKPLVVERTTSQLTSRPMRGWRHNLGFSKNFQASNKRRPHLRNSVAMKMKPIGSEISTQYIPQIQQIQRVQQEVANIDPSIKLAPRFHPIGDLCFNKEGNKPEAVSRSSETTIITPANPPKIECYTESSRLGFDNSAFQIPQISSGSSRTRFRVNGSRDYSKPRGGLISVDKTLNVNPISSDIKMRDHTVDLNIQSLNRVRTNGLKSNSMRSGVVIDNVMNRGINVYSGNSAVVGVAPIASEVQRIPYSLTPEASIFGSGVKLLRGNSNREFISEDSKENSAISLNAQEKMYKGECVPSASLKDHPADLVSLNIMYKHMIESYQRASANAAGVNPISTEKIHEGKLAFGPQKIPINDQVEVVFKEVPEEKLHIVEKPVIELKLDQPSVTSRSFEESAPYISYRDLGFQEKISNSPRFQDISVVSESPKINSEQRIDAEIEPENFERYLKPSKIVIGQLVPTKSVASEYLHTEPLLRSNSMDNSAHQLIPLAQSYVHETHGANYRFISDQQRNNKQLTNINNQISSPLSNQKICCCSQV